MQLTSGEMLYRFRIEKNVKAKQLCYGLCSPSMLSLVEKNERMPDVLQFIYFMERMGISPEQCSIMVTKDEYAYLEWRDRVLETVEKKDWRKLKGLLEEDVAKVTHCNSKIESQFLAYANGIYEASQSNFEAATKLFEQAAKQTVPDTSSVLNEIVLLSTLEISIFMLYLYYGVQSKVLGPTEARKFFYMLERYVNSGILDSDEKAKVYPKLICIGLLSLEELSEEERRQFLEKSIKMARDDKSFYDITEILRLYIVILENENSNQLVFFRTHYREFCDLLEEEELDIGFRPETIAFSRPNYYLLQEYLVSERKAKGLTQENLSEGICEPEAYSRMENGKENPSRNNMKELSQRLGIRWNYYRGELDTCNPRAFHLRMQQRIATIEGRYEESLELLKQLEELLDMSVIENYQYIKTMECRLLRRLEKLDIEAEYEEYKKILATTKKIDFDYEGLTYYSQTELEIVGHMAQSLRKMGRYEEGIELILLVLQQFEKSKLSFDREWKGFRYLSSILGMLYFDIGKYDLCIEIEKFEKTKKVKLRDGGNLPVITDTLADALEHKGEMYKEEYRKLYRDTYYIADFFNMFLIKKGAQNYYESKFEPDIVWYK